MLTRDVELIHGPLQQRSRGNYLTRIAHRSRQQFQTVLRTIHLSRCFQPLHGQRSYKYAPYQINLNETRACRSLWQMVLGIQRMSRLALEERSLWSMYVIGTETGDFDVVFREIIGMFCAGLRWLCFVEGEDVPPVFQSWLDYIRRANFSTSRYKTILILKGFHWGDCNLCKIRRNRHWRVSAKRGGFNEALKSEIISDERTWGKRMGILHGQCNHWEGLISNQVLTSTATRILPPPILYHGISLERPYSPPPLTNVNLVKKGNCVDHFPGCLPSENLQF
jgi:hypothetical protein